ncbi:hypothetical protein ACLOJK_007236, partial [Asimina triloba]
VSTTRTTVQQSAAVELNMGSGPSQRGWGAPSSSGTVYGKDIVSTASDLIFFFSMMTPKKVRHPTPSGEVEAGHPPQPQHEERGPPHNAVATRPLHAADAPPLEDWVLSNSPNPSRESLNSRVTQAKFFSLLEIMKSPQQQMVHVQPSTTSVPPAASADVPSLLAATALTPDMAPNTYHLQATSQPHPSSALRTSDGNSLLAFHLQMQPIPNGFQISEMVIFGPASDPTGHVVNYNIHMDLHSTSKEKT